MTAEEIAAGLSVDERRALRWWVDHDAELKARGICFTNKSMAGLPWPLVDALHNKGLSWSPNILPAIAPRRVCDRPRLLAFWRWLNRRRQTWWITGLIYRLPQPGPTKLGRQVAQLERDVT